MKSAFDVAIVGGGTMAEAIVGGILRSGQMRAGQILVCEPLEERRREWVSRHGVAVDLSNGRALEAPVIVLAVKPQQLDAALRGLSAALDGRYLCVSIAAGKRTDWLAARMSGARIVRVMPNLNSLVGQSMSVYCPGPSATADDARTARSLFAGCGRVLELPEDQFDAVTALSGSGPAFFAYLLDALVRGAEAEGMRREDALALGAQTMLGTATYLRDLRVDPLELMEAVTSQKGTTAAGRAVLEPSDVAETLRRTIAAAAQRSRELSAMD